MAFNAGEIVAKIRAEAAGIKAGIQEAKESVKGFKDSVVQRGKELQATGKKLTTYVTGPIIAIGAMAIKTAGDFQAGMNRVRALSGATGEQFERLRNLAQEMGRTTQFSATQAADALGFLAMAGFDAEEQMEALPGVLQLAAAANLDLAQTADIASNILTGYGIEVSELGRVNDVLAKAMTSANVDLNMLGESMKYAGPVASSAGMAFEESAAAIALMGNAGIQGAMAGTALRGAISRLLNPTAEAARIMDRLGVSATDSTGQLLPLNEIVEQLESSGATTADMLSLFGDRAGPALAALVEQGSDALRDLTGELVNSGGTAKEIADIQMEGLRGAWLKLRSALEGAAISIGNVLLPIVTRIVDKITEWVSWFNNLSKGTQTTTVVIAGLVAAIGPLLWVLGSTIGMLPKIVAGFATLKAAITALTGPIGLAITAIGLIGLAIYNMVTQAREDMKALETIVSEEMAKVAAASASAQAQMLTDQANRHVKEIEAEIEHTKNLIEQGEDKHENLAELENEADRARERARRAREAQELTAQREFDTALKSASGETNDEVIAAFEKFVGDHEKIRNDWLDEANAAALLKYQESETMTIEHLQRLLDENEDYATQMEMDFRTKHAPEFLAAHEDMLLGLGLIYDPLLNDLVKITGRHTDDVVKIIKNGGLEGMKAFAKGVEDGLVDASAAIAVLTELVDGDMDALRTLVRKHGGGSLEAWSSGLHDQKEDALDVLDKVLKEISGSMDLDLTSSGEKTGRTFASGIRNMISTIRKAAREAAAAASNHFPHSPAKEGPLSKLPNWKSYLLDGLENIKSDLGSTLKDVTGAASASINAAIGLPAGGGQHTAAGSQLAMASAGAGSVSTVNHTGTIRIEGVNNSGEFIDAVDIVLQGVNSSRVIREIDYGITKERMRTGQV